MAVNTKNVSKNSGKSYLAKDFNSFRTDLITYARNYFSDQIKDFSEAGIPKTLKRLIPPSGKILKRTLSVWIDSQLSLKVFPAQGLTLIFLIMGTHFPSTSP